MTGRQDSGRKRDDAEAVTFSLVAPVQDDRAGLSELHRRLSRAAEGLGGRYEIIYVDDGSRDGTCDQVRRLIAEDGRVRLVSLSRAFGRAAAVAAGRSVASGQAVVCLEGDRSALPDVVGGLVGRWREGFEVVSASRPPRRDSCALRRAVRRILCWWMAATAGRAHRQRPDIYLLDRKVVAALEAAAERAGPMRGPITEIGFRQASVPWAAGAETAPEPASWRQLTRLAAGDGAGCGLLALRVQAAAGAVLTVLVLLSLVVSALLAALGAGPGAAGWLAMVVLGVFGVQMVLLAAGAEYACARLAAQPDRPPCIVRETCGFDRRGGGDSPNGDGPPKAHPDEILIYT